MIVLLVAAGAALAALLVTFAWPRDLSEQTRFDVGVAEDFTIGSVTTIDEGHFHLVRLSDETFLALSWADPHSHCTVTWRPDFAFGNSAGWFRDPCHGSTYRLDGTRVFGPSSRGLDRYPVEIISGNVTVDTSRYVCGFAPRGAACVEQ